MVAFAVLYNVYWAIELPLEVNVATQIVVYIVEQFTSELEIRVFQNNKYKGTGFIVLLQLRSS